MTHACGTKFCRIGKYRVCNSVQYTCRCSNCGMQSGFKDTESQAIMAWLDGSLPFEFSQCSDALLEEKNWAW